MENAEVTGQGQIKTFQVKGLDEKIYFAHELELYLNAREFYSFNPSWTYKLWYRGKMRFVNGISKGPLVK